MMNWFYRRFQTWLRSHGFGASGDHAEFLDSWADLLQIQMRLTPPEYDANGISDQAETEERLQALRAGAKALRILAEK